jgi:hypothetical protein
MDKLLMSVTAFADEMEREKARQRTADAMVRKARAGHVTGGRVFGYDNIEIRGADGKRSHVERRINVNEAAVVRRIFEMCAAGAGLTAITKALNAEGVPTPRPQQGRPVGWMASSVRAVLNRPLYRGESLWNQTKQPTRGGRNATPSAPSPSGCASGRPISKSSPPICAIALDRLIGGVMTEENTGWRGVPQHPELEPDRAFSEADGATSGKRRIRSLAASNFASGESRKSAVDSPTVGWNRIAARLGSKNLSVDRQGISCQSSGPPGGISHSPVQACAILGKGGVKRGNTILHTQDTFTGAFFSGSFHFY